MSRSEFIDLFIGVYPVWASEKCGAIMTSMLPEISHKMRLPDFMQVYRSPNLVKRHVKAGETNTILLITEKRPSPDPTAPWEDFVHCRLVAPQWASEVWDTVEVDDSISVCNPLKITDSELEKWSPHFCVFF